MDAALPPPSPPPARLPDPRRWLALCFVAYLVALVAGSSLRAVGDGGEYLTMALNLADKGKPWLSEADIARVRYEIADIEGVQDWDIVSSMKPSRYGTFDFVHFWFYSGVAEPFVAMARAFGASPLAGFLVLNAGLLVAAFWIARPRIGGWLTWMVMASPILWWVDKAHTEVFTFSLLSIALLLVTEAPVWAALAIGAAATQNPPILAMVPFAAVALGSRHISELRRPAVWIGLIVALALGSLPIVYAELRHGTPSLLLGSTLRTMPNLAATLVVPFDTNVGLFAAFPALFVVVLLALIVVAFTPRRLVVPGMVLAALTLPVFAISFAQTGNMHHGGTPGMSRYAVWLIPLTLPLLREFHAVSSAPVRVIVALIALPSILWSTFVFHPKQPDNYREPTWLATYMWSRHPAATNPLPEIFVEVQEPSGEQLPIATAGCTKALLIGRGDEQGMWPIGCFPSEIPAGCRVTGSLCYANLGVGKYDFVPAYDVADTRFKYTPSRVWRKPAEATVRRVMTNLGWAALQPGERLHDSWVRQVTNIESVRTLEGPDRLLVTLIGTHDGARIVFRPPQKVSATFVDPDSGDETPAGTFNGAPGDAWSISVPSGRATLLLVLR
jgi:hypothetical protein